MACTIARGRGDSNILTVDNVATILSKTAGSIPVNAQTLQQLLLQKEGPTLEFKQQLYDLFATNGAAKNRQTDELIKDMLSLANGSPTVAGQQAYLVIGADDTLAPDGTRQLYDVTGRRPTEREILQRVNAACNIPIERIQCDDVSIDGKLLFVITIFPSPYLHETNRSLTTPRTTYSQHVVFMRHNESIEIAAAVDRTAILDRKRQHFNELRKAPPTRFGMVVGALIGGSFGASFPEQVTSKKDINVAGGIAGTVVGGIMGAAIGNTYSQVVQLNNELYGIPPRWRSLYASVVAVVSLGFAGVLFRFVQTLERRLKQ